MALSSSVGNRILWGFIAGALSVAIFHQLTIVALNGFNFGAAWRMTPAIAPFGVPAIFNAMFWGGLWGIVFAALSPSLPRRTLAYLLSGLLFGGVVLVLSGWYLVPFVKSFFGLQGLRYGPNPVGWWRGPVINGMWGFGTALLLLLFRRR